MKNSLRLLIPLMLLAVASGCGAKDEPSASSSTSSFAECMQKQGITITMPSGRPSGQPGGERPTDRPTVQPSSSPGGQRPGGGGMQPPSGVDAEAWQKALQACGSMRPSGGPQGNSNTAYTNCLTDHGVTALPPNTADPKTAEAIKACEPLRARP